LTLWKREKSPESLENKNFSGISLVREAGLAFEARFTSSYHGLQFSWFFKASSDFALPPHTIVYHQFF